MFHKAGFPTVFYALLIFIFFNVGNWRLFHDDLLIRQVLLLLSSILLFLVAYFFRKPPPPVTDNNLGLIAPSYGKVVQIVDQEATDLIDAGKLISIFMSPFNIHANWTPMKGEIIHFEHYPGKYLMAFHPKSSELNEHTKVVIKNDQGTILVKQIAGFLARRIDSYKQKGDLVNVGDEIGFIRFGSRLDVVVPPQFNISVKVGDKVRGGRTIIAKVQE